MIDILGGFGLGLVFGSFATLLGHRLPRRLPIAVERSRCPACRGALSPVELIPVLSWAIQGGRCRQCRTPIPARYPLIEMLTGLGFAASVALAGWSPAFLGLAALVTAGAALLAARLEGNG